MAVYEIKESSEGLASDKVVLKKETVESVRELTLNQLEEQLNFAKQELLNSQARVKEIEEEIAKVKETLGIK